MSLTMVGTAYVRKYLDTNVKGEQEWFTEVFGINASTNHPLYMGEINDDFHWTIAGYDWDEIPDEEGLYAVQYAATISWHQDYWGEWDSEADVHWSNITKIDDETAEAFYAEDERVESGLPEPMFQFK